MVFFTGLMTQLMVPNVEREYLPYRVSMLLPNAEGSVGTVHIGLLAIQTAHYSQGSPRHVTVIQHGSINNARKFKPKKIDPKI